MNLIIIFLEVFSVPKPTTNGKSKVFINKPDDSLSDEDDHEQPSIPEQWVRLGNWHFLKIFIWNRIEIKNETFFFFDIDDRLKGKFDCSI